MSAPFVYPVREPAVGRQFERGVEPVHQLRVEAAHRRYVQACGEERAAAIFLGCDPATRADLVRWRGLGRERSAAA